MLMSIPYNKYEDGVSKILNELLCLNNKFDSCLTALDLSSISMKADNFYHKLIELQFSLNKDKTTLSFQEIQKYQKLLDSAFRQVKMINKKIINAKKLIINWSKSGDITSFNDSICFSNDDLIR